MNAIEPTLDHKVRRLSSANIADLVTLHTAVYGTAPRSGFFMQKYNTTFTGVTHVGFLAYNEQGLAIAFYGVIPCFMCIEGEILLAAQSADTMTHPSHRFKGLFTELAEQTFALSRELGIRLIFGFPNQNSLPGFVNKLGWQATGRMDCFHIIGHGFAWRRVLAKLPFLNFYSNARNGQELSKWKSDQTELPNSVQKNGFNGVCRDDAFRSYKTYNETQLIRVGNAVLWVKAGVFLLVGDIELNGEDFDTMMYKLQKLATRLAIKEIQFHCSQGTALHDLFIERYAVTPSFPIIFKNLGACVSLDKIKFTSADIDTF